MRVVMFVSIISELQRPESWLIRPSIDRVIADPWLHSGLLTHFGIETSSNWQSIKQLSFNLSAKFCDARQAFHRSSFSTWSSCLHSCSNRLFMQLLLNAFCTIAFLPGWCAHCPWWHVLRGMGSELLVVACYSKCACCFFVMRREDFHFFHGCLWTEVGISLSGGFLACMVGHSGSGGIILAMF